MRQVEGLVDKETWYPPHSEELLEEHFFRFWASNAHRFPSQVGRILSRGYLVVSWGSNPV